MNRHEFCGRRVETSRRGRAWTAAISVCLVALTGAAEAFAQVPSTTNHVPEMATYLRRVEIAEPVIYRQLRVYPVLLKGGADLPGRWLTLDTAIARGVFDAVPPSLCLFWGGL